MNRRDFLAAQLAVATAIGLLASPAASQTLPFPSMPVRLIVPFQAGGPGDALARLIADKMKTVWTQPIIVENKPGGGGVLGIQALITARHDGHTLILGVVQTILRPVLIPETPYRLFTDLQPITRFGNSQIAFVVRADLPVNSMQEFIAYAKATDKPVSFAASGSGTVVHLYGEMLKKNYMPSLIIALMRGDAQIMVELLGGHVMSSLMALPSIAQHASSQKLKVLAITGQSRSSVLPTVPTFAEAGLPGMESGFWFALFAATGTPPGTVEKIHADLVSVLARDKEFSDRLAALGIVQELSPPSEFTAALRQESARWSQIVAATGVKVEQ